MIPDDMIERAAEAFGEWMHRMHGIVSTCDHTYEARGILEAALEGTPEITFGHDGDEDAPQITVTSWTGDVMPGSGPYRLVRVEP